MNWHQGDFNFGTSSQADFILIYYLSKFLEFPKISSNLFSNSPFPPSPAGRLEQLKPPCWVVCKLSFAFEEIFWSEKPLHRVALAKWGFLFLYSIFFLIQVVVARNRCRQMVVFVVASAKRSCTHLSCSQDSLLREIIFSTYLPRTSGIGICKQSLVSTSSNMPRGDLTLSIIRIANSLTRLCFYWEGVN